MIVWQLDMHVMPRELAADPTDLANRMQAHLEAMAPVVKNPTVAVLELGDMQVVLNVKASMPSMALMVAENALLGAGLAHVVDAVIRAADRVSEATDRVRAQDDGRDRGNH